MNAGSVCKRGVVTVAPTDDLVAAAHLMREKHVGYLIVSRSSPGAGRQVVGVLTDRDIVVAVLAQEVDARALKVGDVMTRDPLLIEEEQSIEAVLRHMREGACGAFRWWTARGGSPGFYPWMTCWNASRISSSTSPAPSATSSGWSARCASSGCG